MDFVGIAKSGGAIGLFTPAAADSNFSPPSLDFGLLSTEGGDRGCPIRVTVSIRLVEAWLWGEVRELPTDGRPKQNSE